MTVGNETASSPGRKPAIETMSGSDTLLWTIGIDPVLRQTVVAVLTLDTSPDWPKFCERLNELTEIVPRLRSHGVIRPVVVGRPQFAEDTNFDLNLHVRRTLLPPGSSFDDVLRIAERMGTIAFDPLLPPWEAMVVEGMDGQRAAIIVKLHHALVDGVGGIAVLGHLLDTRRKVSSKRPAAPTPGTERASFNPVKALRQVGRVTAAAFNAATQPTESARKLMSTGSSVARLLAPAGSPMSPVMTGRGFRRSFEALDLPQGKLRQAATATGSTLNDVFVTAVVRGLRRYHELHGTDLHELRALMPVNVRRERETLGGNHFVPARFRVETGGDAAECLQQTRRITGEWKHASGLAVSEIVATGLSMLPVAVTTSLWGRMLKGDDFCITNVPGPPFRAYIAGSRVEQMYAFAPTSGAALNVSLLSVDGRECVGVNWTSQRFPMVQSLSCALKKGLAKCSPSLGGK